MSNEAAAKAPAAVKEAPKTETPKPAAEAKPAAAPDAKADAPKPPEPAPQAEPAKIAGAWEKLTAQEARLRDEQKKFKTEREAAAKERAELDELRKLRQEDPAALLARIAGGDKEARVLYEELTRRYLNKGEPSQEELYRKQQEKLDALEKWKTEREQREAEAESNRRGQEYIDKVQEALKSDDFELIRTFKAEDEVYNLVIQWKQEHGELLTPQQAASKVEKELESLLPVLKGTKKLSALLGSLPDPSKQEQQPEAKAESAKGQKTPLSSDLSAASPVASREQKSLTQWKREWAAKLGQRQ